MPRWEPRPRATDRRSALRSRLACVGLALSASLPGCREQPPRGQVLVIVDTDLPAVLAGRLRADVYATTGGWIASRDMPLPNAADWPTSFSVYSDEAEDRDVLVRLRVHPEGRVRTYRGERFVDRPMFREPTAPADLAGLCASAPEIAIGHVKTVRRHAAPITTGPLGAGCQEAPGVGSAAAWFEVAEAGSYRMGVVRVQPPHLHAVMRVQRQCEDFAGSVACDAPLGTDTLPDVTVDLQPGRYFVLTGGDATDAVTADLTIGVARASEWASLDLVEERDAAVPDAPRLVLADTDITPETEPSPDVTVDRLVRVHIGVDEERAARVVLRGICAGTMARLSASAPYQAIVADEAETCVDADGEREAVAEIRLDADRTMPATSLLGTFAHEACPEEADGERPCIPGGAYLRGVLGAEGPATDIVLTRPERLVAISAFRVDRHEYTVARLRAAIASGFSFDPAEGPTPNEGPYDPGADHAPSDAVCSWSGTPQGREDHALSCVRWDFARRLCQREGGDLPTESQWEYLATAAGGTYEALFPWGGDYPECSCTNQPAPCHMPVFGRGNSTENGASRGRCELGTSATFGPLPVTAREGPTGDVRVIAPGVTVVGLGGNLREHARDGGEGMMSACWRATPVRDPICAEDDPPLRATRGGSWAREDGSEMTGAARLLRPAQQRWADAGFRCVYPVKP